ncbi:MULTISPECIES: hypothetical protein [unclassified Streptomyces]|uniref:hypothetical protein n=1 Tax=unclassified Streptomyces TaxID=2593676 RepID=UPI0006F77EAA|nr:MULTISPECIES: hypothetical protein [unclassified Streptomyces]KQX53137.1 hypothetical protein ASD33_07980 [Streptomyces sp. Root1304]KRA90058.1 hypothetical protein ASE09_07985 [Streptomyces sp. Root66D1]
MNSEEPRHHGGYGAPGGHGGYGGQSGYGVPAPAAPPRPASHRGAWIGAGATLVAAVIGVVGTYLVSNNGNDNNAGSNSNNSSNNNGAASAPPATQTPSAPQTPEPSSSASSSAAAPATPSAKPTGVIGWQGALAIAYAEPKDLDAAPPVESEINEDNDFSVYPFGSHMLRPERGAKAVVWEDSAKVPSYEDCAGVVDTLGTGKDMKLKTGLVVCARTNDGRLARLTVKELDGQASDTSGTFDVVVWSS